MKNTEVHPFERSIGPGPYRFVGFGKIHVSETFGARYIGPECDGGGCGTCAHCGMGIMNIFVIRAGDGKQYGVGCDCIAKSELPYEVKTEAHKAKLAHERALRAERNKKRTDARLAREAAEFEVFVKWWASDPKAKTSWKKQPHPNEYLAKEKGLSLFDYVEWCVEKKVVRKLRPYAAWIDA